MRSWGAAGDPPPDAPRVGGCDLRRHSSHRCRRRRHLPRHRQRERDHGPGAAALSVADTGAQRLGDSQRLDLDRTRGSADAGCGLERHLVDLDDPRGRNLHQPVADAVQRRAHQLPDPDTPAAAERQPDACRIARPERDGPGVPRAEWQPGADARGAQRQPPGIADGVHARGEPERRALPDPLPGSTRGLWLGEAPQTWADRSPATHRRPLSWPSPLSCGAEANRSRR